MKNIKYSYYMFLLVCITVLIYGFFIHNRSDVFIGIISFILCFSIYNYLKPKQIQNIFEYEDYNSYM